MPNVDLTMPDLGLPAGGVRVSLWLVDVGSAVSAGDRVVELVADGVTVDLSAPVDGVLKKTLVAEDDPVEPGRRLAIFESA
jgi:pyruvate/2-oxoglutarate dehydrogenase complex dihydrolipoamide acyltransferase (E2) component